MEQRAHLPTDRKHEQYAQIISYERRLERSENIDHVYGIVSVRVHTEKVLMEQVIENHGEGDNGKEKNQRLQPMPKIRFDLPREYEINSKERTNHMAKRLARVQEIRLVVKIEQIGVLGANEHSKKQAEPKKR